MTDQPRVAVLSDGIPYNPPHFLPRFDKDPLLNLYNPPLQFLEDRGYSPPLVIKITNNYSMKRPLALSIAAIIAASTSAMADLTNVIAFWSPTLIPIIENSNNPAPWAHNPNTIVSPITGHGTVYKLSGNSTNQALAFAGWGTSLNDQNYAGFTVTPKAGETLTLTGLGFTYLANDPTATYRWRYRINEGAGYGAWVDAPAYPTETAILTWTFATPIVTTGTVEIAFFTTTSTPTTAGTLSIGNANGNSQGNNRGLLLYGTAGDTTPRLAGQGVISRYTRATTYQPGFARETSSITYNWDTDTLFIIDDEGNGIQQVNKVGQSLGGMGMTQRNFPGTGYKGDPEALAYIGNNQFMLGAERQNVSMIVNYYHGGFNTPEWMFSTPDIVWGSPNGNVGLEGLSYDPVDGTYWGVNEKEPMGVNHAVNVGSGSANVGLTTLDLTDLKWRVDFGYSLSDIYVMANSDAYSDSDHLLVLFRDARKIAEITKTGEFVDLLDISHIGRGTIEGLVMDNDGVLYLASEGASTGIDYSKTSGALHVLTPPKNAVYGTTGTRQALVGTTGDDEIIGNPAADTLTGGEGADTFVFSTMRDGVDTITDFTPGMDSLDFGALLRSINYTGMSLNFRPLTDGTVRVVDSTAGAVVQIRVSGAYRSLVILNGLTAAQAGVESNFRFITSKAAN